jgi:hypothetical protein
LLRKVRGRKTGEKKSRNEGAEGRTRDKGRRVREEKRERKSDRRKIEYI